MERRVTSPRATSTRTSTRPRSRSNGAAYRGITGSTTTVIVGDQQGDHALACARSLATGTSGRRGAQEAVAERLEQDDELLDWYIRGPRVFGDLAYGRGQ